jgi:hypothetical protein
LAALAAFSAPGPSGCKRTHNVADAAMLPMPMLRLRSGSTVAMQP